MFPLIVDLRMWFVWLDSKFDMADWTATTPFAVAYSDDGDGAGLILGIDAVN